MKLEFSCLAGSLDIRDYTFIDALKRIGQQLGEEFQFGVWNYDATLCQFQVFNVQEKQPWQPLEAKTWEEAKQEITKNYSELNPKKELFKSYEVKVLSQSTPDTSIEETFLSKSSVLVPLNFCFLEKQAALRLELDNGVIFLKDGDNKEVGSLTLEGPARGKPTVKFKPTSDDKAEPFHGELVISKTGQLILKRGLSTCNLFLGQGFTSYEMDLADWSPVEDQSPGHLCAANAGVSLLEYFERISNGRHLNVSRLFLHQTACYLSSLSPKTGPSVRSVVAALATFGVPPEESWPYDLTKLEEEAPNWCYAQARNYKATSYLSLDRPGMNKDALIAQIKVFVYAGMPAIFGFSIHECIDQSWKMPTSEQLLKEIQQVKPKEKQNQIANHIETLLSPNQVGDEENLEPFDPDQLFCVSGNIPFPTFSELYRGGHAAVVVGYDDEKIIVNSNRLRRHDRERLHLQKVKVFLLEKAGKLKECEWKCGSNNQPEGYIEIETEKALDFTDFNFIHQTDSSGLFILLIKEPKSNRKNEQQTLLSPRDAIDRLSNNRQIDNNVGIVKEYLATKGAFKIRNSLGKKWGEKGYGWLPYAYVYQDLTFDWWSILKFEWMNTDEFGLLRQGDDLVMCKFDECGPRT